MRGLEHPEQSLLLAFIRRECPEHEKRIQEHLSQCPACNQAFVGLSQSSKALSQLKYMARYLRYAELKPELVLAHAQRGTALRSLWTGRRRYAAAGSPARRMSFRLLSLPTAFGLGLLFTMVAVVLAYTLGIATNPFSSSGHSTARYYNSRLEVVTVPARATPTSTGSNTRATLESLPVIQECSKKTGQGHHNLMICGVGFKAGDRVWLIVNASPYKQPKKLGPWKVDAKGRFEAILTVPSCKFLPTLIYAEDTSGKQNIDSIGLTDITLAGCQQTGPPSNHAADHSR